MVRDVGRTQRSTWMGGGSDDEAEDDEEEVEEGYEARMASRKKVSMRPWCSTTSLKRDRPGSPLTTRFSRRIWPFSSGFQKQTSRQEGKFGQYASPVSLVPWLDGRRGFSSRGRGLGLPIMWLDSFHTRSPMPKLSRISSVRTWNLDASERCQQLSERNIDRESAIARSVPVCLARVDFGRPLIDDSRLDSQPGHP